MDTRRHLDHLVLPVATLAGARTFFEALGFTVAPDAVHPFGTANACVFFADGTYLEPLAVFDAALCRDEARSGNVFVGRDQAFRAGRGVPGFSGIGFASASAEADQADFEKQGLADGEIYQFSRVFLSAGREKTLTFRLAFAADKRAPDLFFFACQAMAAKGDRSALSRHANGVTGLRRLVLSAARPDEFAGLLAGVTGGEVAAGPKGGLTGRLANAAIEVLDADGLADGYGRGCGAEEGLVLAGIVLGVRDIGSVQEIAERAGLAPRTVGGRLVVDLDGSQQSFIAFEAI